MRDKQVLGSQTVQRVRNRAGNGERRSGGSRGQREDTEAKGSTWSPSSVPIEPRACLRLQVGSEKGLSGHELEAT